MLERGRITPENIDKLASAIAAFHTALPPAAADSPHCATTAIQVAASQNFTHLPQLLSASNDLAMLEAVRQASANEFATCEPFFRQRAAAGCVRECHGDLHLGNIVLLDDTPIPFDCIEFSAALRWIDVISEIAFPVMDLLRRGHAPLAWRLLNAYLENIQQRMLGILTIWQGVMTRALHYATLARYEQPPLETHIRTFVIVVIGRLWRVEQSLSG